MTSTPLLTPEALELLGYEAPVRTLPEVRLDDIVRYCCAIDDLSCLYADAGCTELLPPERVEAPPDFCQSFRFRDAPLSDLAEDGLPPLRDDVPRLPVRAQRVLYGGAQLESHLPIRVGDVIQVKNVIVELYERDGESGPAAFSVVEMTCHRGQAELVSVLRTTTIYR